MLKHKQVLPNHQGMAWRNYDSLLVQSNGAQIVSD